MEPIDLYLKHLPNLKRISKLSPEWKCICPFHQEEIPSFFVNEKNGLFYCQGCGKGGTLKKFLDEIGVVEDTINLEYPAIQEKSIEVIEEINPKVIEQFHRNLLNDNSKLIYVLRERLVSFFTIKKFLLGYDTGTGRYAFPMRSRSGKYINIKLHNSQKNPKSLHFKTGTGAKLFPVSALLKSNIVICEGEFDSMALHSLGINSITSTSGANGWNPSWNEFFFQKNVKILYDTDQAGRDGAEDVKNNLLSFALSVESISIPTTGQSKVDVTDFLRAKGDIFRLLRIVRRK